MTREAFVEAVAAFCAVTEGSVTSWLRSSRHNAAVGGVPNSAHLYGLGADIVYDFALTQAEVTERARRLGLRLIREGDHDHLQPLDWPPG